MPNWWRCTLFLLDISFYSTKYKIFQGKFGKLLELI
jgi:hypothetical protein